MRLVDERRVLRMCGLDVGTARLRAAELEPDGDDFESFGVELSS